jgi:hypothetical protein
MFQKLSCLLMATSLTIYASGEPKREQSDQYYERAAKSRKYTWIHFSITHFDIDKVNEYALAFKKTCPDWPKKSNLRNWGGRCDLSSLSEDTKGWVGFCNAHGGQIHAKVIEALNSGDQEAFNKAINFLYMRNDLCTGPKLYAESQESNN